MAHDSGTWEGGGADGELRTARTMPKVGTNTQLLAVVILLVAALLRIARSGVKEPHRAPLLRWDLRRGQDAGGICDSMLASPR